MDAIQKRQKLVNRVRRIIGQLQGVERALEGGSDCGEVLHTISACRGALNGLMVEVVAGEVRERVVEGRDRARSSEAAEALLEALRSYLA